jgi:hypothetical protein
VPDFVRAWNKSTEVKMAWVSGWVHVVSINLQIQTTGLPLIKWIPSNQTFLERIQLHVHRCFHFHLYRPKTQNMNRLMINLQRKRNFTRNIQSSNMQDFSRSPSSLRLGRPQHRFL